MNKHLLTLFPLTAVAVAVGLALTRCGSDSAPVSSVPAKISAVEFTETPAPTAAEVDKMAKTFTTSKAIVTYEDGSTKEFPLSYNVLFSVKDKVGGNPHPAGQLYDYQMNPLTDPFGQPLIAETPDANSLLNVDGQLFLVTHVEYDWLLSDGSVAWKKEGWYTRAPTGMVLSHISQDKSSGKLSVTSQEPINFSAVNGTWINCFGSQTPWNTHLGSEEDYDLQYNPFTGKYKLTEGGVKAMTELYFRNTREASPYDYGHILEVKVNKDGRYTVSKHYAMGRGTWELAKIMPDGRTAYLGDDGSYGFMAMFVADKYGDLDAGSLYAAKWNQLSDKDGGKANLTWVYLGHATSDEIKKMIDGGISFYDIFDAVAPEDGTCPAGYTRIRAGSSADECLSLKPNMEKAAAFLESRRYAALKGATTEFTKMEGIALNAKDKKLYMAMSSIKDSMTSETGEPADHIKLPKNKAGATYTLDLSKGQKDTDGNPINSDYVATLMYVEPALLGKPLKEPDVKGNTADENFVANTDNVFFAEKMRTLFIGEDSGMHVNNYVWAYNVDTKKLTRILSSTAGAENTGLQVVEDRNGYAYIMSNNQHWGDLPKTVKDPLKSDLLSRIDRFYAPVGYIGGLPAIK